MQQNRINIVAHIAGWVLFFSLVIGFVTESHRDKDIVAQVLSGSFLVFGFIYLLLFYLNAYVLVPALYIKQKYLLYILAILVLFIAVYYIKPFDNLMSRHAEQGRPMPPPVNDDRPSMPPREPRQTDIVSIILFITVWSLSTAICIIRQWRHTEKRAMQAEADKTNAELSFLKAQINPHFLFNTLNNIYSQVVAKNDNAAEGIMKLSNIMRYVTDDIKNDLVPLEGEIDCLKDYIDLQKMRLNDKTEVRFEIMGNAGNKTIAPLLLMTFVENAFKYGTSSHEFSSINVRLSITDTTIDFTCQNKLFETKRQVERPGIGIQNAKQRLMHLYPNKHTLNIDPSNGMFTVQLTLQV